MKSIFVANESGSFKLALLSSFQGFRTELQLQVNCRHEITTENMVFEFGMILVEKRYVKLSKMKQSFKTCDSPKQTYKLVMVIPRII